MYVLFGARYALRGPIKGLCLIHTWKRCNNLLVLPRCVFLHGCFHCVHRFFPCSCSHHILEELLCVWLSRRARCRLQEQMTGGATSPLHHSPNTLAARLKAWAAEAQPGETSKSSSRKLTTFTAPSLNWAMFFLKRLETLEPKENQPFS